ncbi:RNA one modulator [Klebsiella pneumoniae]|nr:RNA one modulator [Klebsiella pneumoniae]
MTKQEKTALNMAKFIKEQSLLLLDKLNELDMAGAGIYFLPNGHHRRAGLSSGSSGTGTLK